MKRLSQFSIVVLLLFRSIPQTDAQNFQRRYASGGDDPDLNGGIAILSNDNLIVSGIYAFDRTLLLGLAPDGTVLWRKGIKSDPTQIPKEFFFVFSIQPLPTGNAIVLMRNSKAIQDSPYLMLIAEVAGSDGSIVWQRYIGTENAPTVYWDAAVLADGILLSGYIGNQYSLAKISFTGDLIWQRNYKGEGDFAYAFNAITVSPEGDIYAVGSISGNASLCLSKFNELGEQLWSKRYSLAENNAPRIILEVDIALTADGQPVLWGSTSKVGSIDNQIFILQSDKNDGAVKMSKTVADPSRSLYTSDILPLPDHTFLLCMSDVNGGEIAHYLKYDLKEGPQWSHIVPNTGSAGILYATVLNSTGHLYSISQQLSLIPLERASILTRSDQLLTNQPDCCHQIDSVVFENQVFTEEEQILVPGDQQWIESNKMLTWITPPTTTALICGQSTTNTDFELSETTICTGGCVNATPISTNGQELIWEATGLPPVVSSNGATFCFEVPGTYSITATSAQDSCSRVAKRITVVNPLLPTIVSLDSLTCPGECTLFKLDSIHPNYQYNWSFEGGIPTAFMGSEPPVVCYPQSGLYTVAVNVVGCLSSTDTTIEVKYRSLLTPNAFTPNGDNINDSFSPLLKCPATNYHFVVYNRWGQVVFETRTSDQPWDGTAFGQPQPVDTYIWTLELTDIRDNGSDMDQLKGEVTLLR